MEKELFQLTELSNITFVMINFKDKSTQSNQVDYNSDQLSYFTSQTFLSM